MVKKLKKLSAEKATSAHTGAQLASSVKESAQQIWLAGLGAFSKPKLLRKKKSPKPPVK